MALWPKLWCEHSVVVLQPSQSLQMFLNFYVDIHLAGFEAKPSTQHMFQNFDVYINLVVLNKINCYKCFNNLDVNEAKSVTINVSKWRSECSFGDVQELSQSQQIFLNCDVHVHLVMLKPSQSQQNILKLWCEYSFGGISCCYYCYHCSHIILDESS